ncbi:heavy metal translocating P-type ATPase [Ferrimonas senticii]|uniref:heavy metal translocating P-type ATPase n=1 Tax=Ferrimonas senticii TaxID=394566 RepID=UPI00048A19BA|nr:heavy metal translocating P-type ATPase [Ferrimonas senticii]
MSLRCFHCAEPVPAGSQFHTIIDGVSQPMCCPGCAAVADAILAAGLSDYYRYRTEPGAKQDLPSEIASLAAYDLQEVQHEFIANSQQGGKPRLEVLLSIDGISCAACAWLIEKHLHRLAGVRIDVNTTTQRALLSWPEHDYKLSQLLTEIASIGYRAAPFQLDSQEQENAKQSQKLLLRVGLAGLATMQVMMLAVALYTGYFHDLESHYRDFIRWVSLLFATPVVLYSAQPFYFSATRALLGGRINMDLPVSIAILLAYGASVKATWLGVGEVYFESVSMFTFFLLLGRLAEQRARRKASEHASNRQKLIPLTARLISADGEQQIAASGLSCDHVIRVLPGERIPADGVIIAGQSDINEAMLTGEQQPVPRNVGDTLYAGTINLQQPLQLKVTAVGAAMRVNTIVRLQEAAAASKPEIAKLADRIANYFVPALLLLALATYLFWHFYQPEQAFWVTLSVLVATCPCALALATPAALTCGTAKMTEHGLLVRSARVLETLPKLTSLLFDKTGTLTEGQFTLTTVEPLATLDNHTVLSIAAALEAHSSHPYAQAFRPYAQPQWRASDNQNHLGQGISGSIDGKRYRIGTGQFCGASSEDGIYLADDQQLLARFVLADKLRVDAKHTIGQLSPHYHCAMLSGDPNPQAVMLAQELGLEDAHFGLSPEQKLAQMQQLQQRGQRVAMFGDGVNDAPVLAGADLSVAMGQGTDLAQCSADLILLGSRLAPVLTGITIAKQTHRIIRQNLTLSLCYNAAVVPLAVCGLVPPYLAAAGMSLSSLAVLGNSLRLLKDKT